MLSRSWISGWTESRTATQPPVPFWSRGLFFLQDGAGATLPHSKSQAVLGLEADSPGEHAGACESVAPALQRGIYAESFAQGVLT